MFAGMWFTKMHNNMDGMVLRSFYFNKIENNQLHIHQTENNNKLRTLHLNLHYGNNKLFDSMF